METKQTPVTSMNEDTINDEMSATEISQPEDNKLIFGKFKSLEEAHKGYQEAERAVSRASELEQELRRYQEQAEIYEQEAIARRKGYADRISMMLEHDVQQHELDNYAKAAHHTLPPEQQLMVNQLIEKCRFGGSKAEMAQLRRCFTPEVVALAAEDLTLFRNDRQAQYDDMRNQDRQMFYTRKLDGFKREFGDWADSPLKVDIIKEAMAVTDGMVDLPALKRFVDEIEKQAVEKYRQTANLLYENQKVQDSLTEPANSNARSKGKKWLTREEYYNLTPEQEDEKYDLIVEQILLEKQGLLPRTLI